MLLFDRPLVATAQRNGDDNLVVRAHDGARVVTFHISSAVARRHLGTDDVVLQHVLSDWTQKIERACCRAYARATEPSRALNVYALDFLAGKGASATTTPDRTASASDTPRGPFSPRSAEQERAAILKDLNRTWQEIVRHYAFDHDRHGRKRPPSVLPARMNGSPTQHYRRWSREEESALRALLEEGCSVEVAAGKMQRSLDSIKSKAFLLRLKTLGE